MKDPRTKQRPSSLLGLSLDGNLLTGVVLRRTNGSLVLSRKFSANLSLDPLTNDPELVGREIQNRLEEAGIRERRCAVCVPLSWALIVQTKLPELSEEDVPSFLQLEAERGFPYAPETLLISTSSFRTPAGESYVTQVAVPRESLSRFEKALKAARLKPVAFALGIAALQDPGSSSAPGVLALSLGETGADLQVCLGGGVAGLRTLQDILDTESGPKRAQPDVVAREIRIALGQLPGVVRDAVRQLRIFGRGPLAEQLAGELRSGVRAMGLTVDLVSAYAADEFGVRLPAETEVSPAFSLAARQLLRRNQVFDFLPPKVAPWQRFAARYSSGKLVWAGATAAVVALILAALFLFQQWQLSRYRSEWAGMATTVNDLETMQQQIRKFRPWFDDSMRNLSILRRLTEAFPEEGIVSAKTVEIRDQSLVTCSGTAQDNQALLKTLDQLRATKEIGDVKVDQIRGSKPIQFTFNFHWGERTSHER